MTIKLAPSLVAFSLIGLTPLGQDTDHYDPDAQRKVFQTSIDWQINRLGVVFDYTTYDILAMFEPLKGETTWNLSVRDTPKREDGELVKIQRDYEDVILETQHSVSTDDLVQEPMELFGGMERERVTFHRYEDSEDWEIELPAKSQLDAEGLLGLQAPLDLGGFAPPADVEDGDTWDIPLAALEELLFPVGHPATLLAPMGWARIAEVDVPQGGAVQDSRGSLEGTWGGYTEAKRLSSLELEVDVVIDLQPQSALAAAGQAYMDGNEYQNWGDDDQASGIESELRVTLKGTGSLIWNHELGAFEGLDLELDYGSTLELDLTWGETDFRVEADVVGEIQLEYSR